MAEEKKGKSPEAGKPAESARVPVPIPGEAHAALHVAATPEELSDISRKMEQAVKLFAEVASTWKRRCRSKSGCSTKRE